MPLEIFSGKEQPESVLPKETEGLMRNVINDIIVREHLKDNKAVFDDKGKDWDKGIDNQMRNLNQEIAARKISRRQIEMFLEKLEEEKTSKGNTFYNGISQRFWVKEKSGSIELTINHFFSIEGRLGRILLANQIDNNSDTTDSFIDELNRDISRIRPAPVAGELEMWLKAKGADRILKIENGKVVRKK